MQKNKKNKKIKNGQFFFDIVILQLQHTVISNSEKLIDPTVQLDIKFFDVECFIRFFVILHIGLARKPWYNGAAVFASWPSVKCYINMRVVMLNQFDLSEKIWSLF